jgi:hypothetical protein
MVDPIEAVFFAYVDREEATLHLPGTAPPSVAELTRRHEAFQAYLASQLLSCAQRHMLLEAYEGYLLVQYAGSGQGEAPAGTGAHQPDAPARGRSEAVPPGL